MLRTENGKQMSFFSMLYDKIPEDYVLKRIWNVVDFDFINELLEDSYCKNFGRPAKEPALMMELCFLEYLYSLSDEKVMEEASLSLAFLWFLGLNPEDTLPHPSLLAKFRTQRLKDITLDEVITEIVCQCIERCMIKGTDLAVDTTHIEANCTKKVPERIMKHLAKAKSKARKLQVAASAPLFYELSQEQKQPEFQEKYKKRAAQEWKNAEMKRFHGMSRARGWGLRGIRIQVKLTAIAVNLKRIAVLAHASKPRNEEPGIGNASKKGCIFVFASIIVHIYAQFAKNKAQNLCTSRCT